MSGKSLSISALSGALRTLACVIGFGMWLITPARAESLALSCVSNVTDGVSWLVYVDYATSAASLGHDRNRGAEWGPYQARISEQLISFDDQYQQTFTVNRLNGLMSVHQQKYKRTYFFSCSPLAAKKGKRF
jgi:hypothetical protein